MVDKKVKIIATIGPATYTKEMLKKLAEVGVDVFRITLAHASREDVFEKIGWIREIEKELERPLAVMGDLPGPKIRIGDIDPGTFLDKGQTIKVLKKEIVGNKEQFSLNHPSLIDALEKGTPIYIDDGAIKLTVKSRENDHAVAAVDVGGELKSRKGFSAEGMSLAPQGVSERERELIRLVQEAQCDAMAISFVQTAQDVRDVKELLPKDSRLMVVVKIETEAGVKNAEEILEVADAIMVARGDLGLAVPIAQVPHIQKQLINLCLKKAKPVVTCTQMLESMITRPIPTRAEVTDVANAILDGTDCVMLSAETAVGKFPIETVETMVKIIREAITHRDHIHYQEEPNIANAVSAGAGNIADEINAKLIVAFTESGSTARRISRHRHKEPVIALSPSHETVHQLNFSWGVYPQRITSTVNFDNMREQAKKIASENHVRQLGKNDPFVITAGMPFGQSGTTNLIFIEKV